MKLHTVIPTVLVKEASPMQAFRQISSKLYNISRAASKAAPGKPVNLRNMDFISRGAKPGGEHVGSVYKQLKLTGETARDAMGAAKGSPIRNELAQDLRYLRNAGVQSPTSKTTFSRFGSREPNLVAGPNPLPK
jgi:hypothetical protein